jgi:hypothetical protein
MDAYVEMIYRWCLTRIIHFIVVLRLAHPLSLIFIVKYDYSDAYCRVAHSALTAAQSIIVFAGVAYITLQLTFGGSPNPPTWCAFSKNGNEQNTSSFLTPASHAVEEEKGPNDKLPFVVV